MSDYGEFDTDAYDWHQQEIKERKDAGVSLATFARRLACNAARERHHCMIHSIENPKAVEAIQKAGDILKKYLPDCPYPTELVRVTSPFDKDSWVLISFYKLPGKQDLQILTEFVGKVPNGTWRRQLQHHKALIELPAYTLGRYQKQSENYQQTAESNAA